MAKSPASNDTLELPDAVYEELQRLRDLIRSDTVKRELWGNRFTAADRRKFSGPEKEVLKQHHTIELWHIARGTPTPNQCIVEVAYAVGLLNNSRRDSLLDALGAKLQKDGAYAFVKSWNELLDVIVKKSQTVAAAGGAAR
jgi:hypothetical protein